MKLFNISWQCVYVSIIVLQAQLKESQEREKKKIPIKLNLAF